ncbi:exocyst subunit exo70 family protein F1 [Rhynchospora pubera]|uniref:Exocyst subunit Exo70 family protein n=1 Tax=Rhynchospora pubera TaxID=906938 RepID=A0AAV8FID4_9POAL|nr:exocyst subunit exo70 family protein F1 [Rhynchospora pubera]
MDEEFSLTEPSSDKTERLDAIEKLVVLWDPSIYDLPVLRGHYFHTVDEVISLSTCGFPDHLQTRAKIILEVTMSRLEDKFCRLMMQNHFLTETDLLSVSYQSISDHYPHRNSTATSYQYNRHSHNASTHSRTNSGSTHSRTNSTSTPPTSSDIVSFSSNSAENPDEYHSPQESHFGSIVDASEIFTGDISDMKAIAHRMIHANHGPRLARAFVTACSEIVMNDFSLILGFQELTKEEAQTLPWDALSREMKNWVRATKVTFQVILPRKRWLCDEIFGTEMHGAVFDEAAKSSVMRLIKFAKAASHRMGSAKIIFHLLSMYETLIDALVGTERLFADIANEFINAEIEGTINHIGKAVLGILPVWLDKLAENHLSHTEEGQEGIHPFTKYAIAYISLLVMNHRHSLNILLHDEVTITGNGAVLQGQSEITLLGHIVLTLLSNLNSVLEHKSEKMEPGKQEIFLINNLHYILNLVKDSVLKLHLSADWFQELHEQIDRLLSRYLKSCWGNVLASLIDKNLRQRKGMMLFVSTYKAVLRQKLKKFNSAFEATCSSQSSWKVSNPELRQVIRRAISEMVVPVYKLFLAEYHVDPEIYTPKSLEDTIFGLFEG